MNFKEGRWNHEINVTDFVKTNITPYEGDSSFLVGPTERTKAVWNKCLDISESTHIFAPHLRKCTTELLEVWVSG